MDDIILKINISKQIMLLYQGNHLSKQYLVSTAKNGVGEKKNSFQTPRGWHLIRAKVGGNCSMNTVFVGRRPTGEIYSEELAKQFPGRDWMLTRIMWLSGLEIGKNRLGDVDTMQRYIYIHGTPDTTNMQIPGSKGCIRMRNRDIIELFDLVKVGTKVEIVEN